jgi:cytosine/adenosine deaminase-related metal-dependent hydrolase
VLRGRCSVLIKVTPDFQDLLLGHVTWWTYTGMTRLYKHYSFALHGKQYNTRLTSMSSYPGVRSGAASGIVAAAALSDLLSSSCCFDSLQTMLDGMRGCLGCCRAVSATS